MEFKFCVSDIFPTSIVEINQNLLPPGFNGDRRALWDVTTKMSEIVNSMGDASAAAQGLTKPITTADRLRNSDQIIYLLVDRNAKSGKGVVTGMLKTGKKSLYVFDRDGHHYQVSPPCVLDFYVHESRQRTGLGKQLFEHMLQKEKVEPVKLAVDRPSDKLLSFLNKHYGLNNALRQMNNYVVFDGFFPGAQDTDGVNGDGSISGSPNRSKQSANGLQQNFTSPYGRYGAPRPPCSMGQIIHNQSPVQSNEPTGLSLNMRAVRGPTKSAPTIQGQQHQQQQQQQGYSNQMQTGVCQSTPNLSQAQPQQVYHMQQQQMNPNVMQQLTNPYVTQQSMQPNMTQPQTTPSMTESQINIAQQMNPNIAQQQANPNTAQQQMIPNMIQQTNPNVAQQINPNVAQQLMNPNVIQQQMNAVAAQQQINPNVAQVTSNIVQQTNPNMAQQLMNPNMIQQEMTPNVVQPTDANGVQQQMNPNTAQEMMPNMAQQINANLVHQTTSNIAQQMIPNVTQQQINPSMSLPQMIPNMPQQTNPYMVYQTSSNMTQQITPNVAEQQMNPNMTPNMGQQMNSGIAQQPISRAMAQQTNPTMPYYNQQTQSNPMVPSQNQTLVNSSQGHMNLHRLQVKHQLHQEQLNNGISPRLDANGLPETDNPLYYATDPYRQDRMNQQGTAVSSQRNIIPESQYLYEGYPPVRNSARQQYEQAQRAAGMGMLLPPQHMIQPAQITSPLIPQQVTQPPAPTSQPALVPLEMPSQQTTTQLTSTPLPHMTQSSQPNLNTAQLLSAPGITTTGQTQQVGQATQSVPALQSGAQGYANPAVTNYQQYVQPPNTEQPMQMKPAQYATQAQPAGQVGAPYKYYDSTAATMQTNYAQPYSTAQTPQNVIPEGVPNAAGDMPPIQKAPEYYGQPQMNTSNAYVSEKTVASAPSPPEQMTQATASGTVYQQQQPTSDHHKPIDDSISQSPKLERPRSLSIQRSEDLENLDKKIAEDIKSEVHQLSKKEQANNEVDNVAKHMEEELEITGKIVFDTEAANSSEKHENGSASDDSESRSKSPNPLTAQGFFDLKFYHSRLW